jgi:N4-gp56 family major capsid protein
MHAMKLNLRWFDGNTQTTDSAGLSDAMKTYYEKTIIDYAEPKLIHDQFAAKYPIPKNKGKKIEFRKYDPLPKALTPLSEGVTPDGQNMSLTTIEATVDQYGGYYQITDVLELTAIDPIIVQASKALGSQAGRTLDTVTREVINGGTNVLYAPKGGTEITSRADITAAAVMTPELAFRAATMLAAMDAPKIGDSYVGIIHPNAAYDLMRSDEWIDVSQYAKADQYFNGEVGKIGGIRFVATSEAKIWGPGEIANGYERLTVRKKEESSTTKVEVSEILTTATGLSISVYIGGVANTITAIESKSTYSELTLNTGVTVEVGDKISGAEAGKDGSAVFSVLVVGEDAYATTELAGGGLEHIIKQKGYGDDPLNQRSSVGWKATKVAERLIEPYMVRIECGSKFSPIAKSN